MASLSVSTSGTSATWYVYSLSNYWNTSNYIKAVVSQSSGYGGGGTSTPPTVDYVTAPSSGSSYQTQSSTKNNLTAGQTYTWYAYAQTPDGKWWDAGNSTFTMPPPPTPYPPSGISSSVSGLNFTIYFTKGSNTDITQVDYYWISGYPDASTSGTSFSGSVSSYNTTYQFDMRGYNSTYGTYSNWTSTYSFTTGNPPPPSVPSSGVTLNTGQGSSGRGDGTLYLQWGSSNGTQTYYQIAYRVNDPMQGTGSWTYLNVGNVTTYQLNGLSYGYQYELEVNACNGGGCSAFTTSNYATTLPQSPQSMSTTSTSTSVSATPSINSGQYTKITVTLKNGATTVSSQDVLNGATATFSGLSSGVTYTAVAQTYYTTNGTTLWSFNSLSQNISTSSRPSNWQWTTACDASGHKISGNNFSILASEWNNFTSRVQQFRTYKGMTTVTFTQAVSGNTFTAAIFNQALDDMVAIPTLGSGFISTHVSTGDGVTASRLNNVMDALNAVQ